MINYAITKTLGHPTHCWAPQSTKMTMHIIGTHAKYAYAQQLDLSPTQVGTCEGMR